MLAIKKKYIVDEKTAEYLRFRLISRHLRKLKQLLEDYALAAFIKENKPEDKLTLQEAKDFYKNLKKAD